MKKTWDSFHEVFWGLVGTLISGVLAQTFNLLDLKTIMALGITTVFLLTIIGWIRWSYETDREKLLKRIELLEYMITTEPDAVPPKDKHLSIQHRLNEFEKLINQQHKDYSDQININLSEKSLEINTLRGRVNSLESQTEFSLRSPMNLFAMINYLGRMVSYGFMVYQEQKTLTEKQLRAFDILTKDECNLNERTFRELK